jgi:hypothetical protein
MKYICFLFFGLINFNLVAQEFSIDKLPDSLKENADVIKQFESVKVTIKSSSKAVVHRKYIVTVLNSNGDNHAKYFNVYTKLISLSDISGKLYDANGNLIRSIKKKDIADLSMADDVSLLTDTRSKSFSFYHKTYPYTVEFEDEQVFDGMFFLPNWMPFDDEKMSVVQSQFSVEMPLDYTIRYKQYNYLKDPLIVENKSRTLSWEIKNQKAIVYEELSPSWRLITPSVFIAATEFEFGEYKGNMSTWKSLGLFVAELNKGKSDLPDNVKQDVKAITAGLATIKDKTEALYGYMQKNTRYISIQLGIGSWQPFDAKYVANNKYGDCKALSNYMVSLLSEAGIKAHYVLIDAGDFPRKLLEEFPAPMFNHAIACVPNGNDTIWLECTSQTTAAGYMGTFTGNRKALLIADDGGHIVHTPIYQPMDNQQIRSVHATLNAQGDLSAFLTTKFTGEQQELQHSLIHEASETRRNKYLNSVISLPTYKVNKSSYKEVRKPIPEVTEELQIEAPSYATVSGKRLFVTPNLFNKAGFRLSDLATRQYPIVFQANYFDVDTVKITIPNEYTIESLPKSVNLKSDFGDYSISFLFIGSKIEMIRKYTRQKVEWPKEKYIEAQKYFDAIRRADNSRFVFVKNDAN